jgi:hypothetical protein
MYCHVVKEMLAEVHNRGYAPLKLIVKFNVSSKKLLSLGFCSA